MISSATRVRGESQSEPDDRKKRSTGERREEAGPTDAANRSVMRMTTVQLQSGALKLLMDLKEVLSSRRACHILIQERVGHVFRDKQ